VLVVWLVLVAPSGGVLGAPRTLQEGVLHRRSRIIYLPVVSGPPPLRHTAAGVTAARTAMVPNGRLISGWGAPRSGGRTHEGEDIAAPHDSPIAAPARLTITMAGWNTIGGWTVMGRDALGRRWYFAHLATPSPVEAGNIVDTGQILGAVGMTGNAEGTTPHLHYQVSWPGGAWGNPVEVLRSYPDVP
jgi:murein DD-endopeptidase MepM/ murein hydrolase activator NlpD